MFIRLTKGMVAIIDEVDAELANRNWYYSHGYARRDEGPKGGQEPVFLHREVAKRMGLAAEGREIDHVDTDGLNDTRSNLRVATRSQNEMNTKGHRDSLSGRKGVTWDRARQKWKAQIQLGGKDFYLGGFQDIEAASAAYAAAARRLYGEFARTS